MRKLITLCAVLIMFVSCTRDEDILTIEPKEEEPITNTLYLLDVSLTDDFRTNALFRSDTLEFYKINTLWGPRYDEYRKDISIEHIHKDSSFIMTPYGNTKALRMNNYTALDSGLYKIIEKSIASSGQSHSIINDLANYSIYIDQFGNISLFGEAPGVNKEFVYELKVYNSHYQVNENISLVPDYLGNLKYNRLMFHVVQTYWLGNNVREGWIILEKIQ